MDEHGVLRLLALAEHAGNELKGLDAKSWRDQLESRYQDLVEAIGWLVDHGRANEAMKLTVALYAFWTLTGRIAEGRTLIGRAMPSREAVAYALAAQASGASGQID